MSVERAVLLVVAVLLLAVLVLLLTRWRSRTLGEDQLDDRGAVVTNSSASQNIEPAVGIDELVLVPLPNRRNEALVMGSEQALSVLDASGLTRRPPNGERGPLPQLIRSGMAVGGLEATRQAQHGIDSGRIVAVSRESMNHLERGRPVYDQARNLLGVVRGDKGRISHVMRLDQAGAQAVVASNAATLAVTAALSLQLEHIVEQLAEISETLNEMVRDKNRERLAEVIAANEALLEVATNVRRRGITQTDANQLVALKLPVIAKQIEAEFKIGEVLDEVLGNDFDDLTKAQRLEKFTRAERLDKLTELVEEGGLEYWLAVRVQADLARTRSDLLRLYWEHHEHPETAPSINESIRTAMEDRQRRLALVGEILRELSHPEARTPLDSLRQLSRYRLGKERKRMDVLLSRHGAVFASPQTDPYAVIEGAVGTDRR